jgi:large subunit ribosomal protein L10
MPSQKKIDAVKEIQNIISSYSDFFVTEFRGLTVADITDLRRKLRENGAVYQVIKNNILKVALSNKSIEGLDHFLVGPNAFLFTKDPVSSAKVLKEKFKDKLFAEKIKIKGGYTEGKVIDKSYVEALADLPSKNELLGKMLGTLKNPASRLVKVLNNPLQKFAFALKAIADKKQ